MYSFSDVCVGFLDCVEFDFDVYLFFVIFIGRNWISEVSMIVFCEIFKEEIFCSFIVNVW